MANGGTINIWWLLEKGRSVFLRVWPQAGWPCSCGFVPHSLVYGQRKVNSVGYFWKGGTKLGVGSWLEGVRSSGGEWIGSKDILGIKRYLKRYGNLKENRERGCLFLTSGIWTWDSVVSWAWAETGWREGGGSAYSSLYTSEPQPIELGCFEIGMPSVLDYRSHGSSQPTEP